MAAQRLHKARATNFLSQDWRVGQEAAVSSIRKTTPSNMLMSSRLSLELRHQHLLRQRQQNRLLLTTCHRSAPSNAEASQHSSCHVQQVVLFGSIRTMTATAIARSNNLLALLLELQEFDLQRIQLKHSKANDTYGPPAYDG